ncbi:MAG: segregation and condensation protein A [Gammaproteobacteria bacterium]
MHLKLVKSPGPSPLAVVRGEPLTELPVDLYIPPDALRVFLEAFEGPLDLLIYLIKRHNLDILDIPIFDITRQYMEYVEIMKGLQLDLAAEYLLMAAMLAEIKSRMLLPRPVEIDDEADPRAELVRRLQEYERFRQAAEDIDALPRLERDIFNVAALPPEVSAPRPLPEVSLKDMLAAFKGVLQRAEMFSHHHIRRESLSVRERMSSVLSRLKDEQFTAFTACFTPQEGRAGVNVTLLAVLELIRERLIDLVQAEPFAPIYLRPAACDSGSAATGVE